MIVLLALAACSDVNEDDLLLPRDSGDTAVDTGDAPALPTGDEGLLLLNGKLSSAASNYTLNTTDADGDWIGASLYVYDPADPGALRRLGWLHFGPDDGLHDWETMTAREVAVTPDGAVWVVLIDQGTDDEWLIARVDVPALTGTDQALPVTPYAVNPADAALYGAIEITGAGYDPAARDGAGALLLGTPAEGAFPGAVFTVAVPPTPDEADPYYAAAGLLADTADLTGNLGVAGDIAAVGDTPFALVRSGTDFTANALYDLDAAALVGDATPRAPDEPLTALAVVNGALVGVGIEGDVWRVDPDTGAFTQVDDLGPALPDDDRGQPTRRIRGGATVRIR